ncbi:MAG: hypothetical protein HY040_21405 [Planctomycetes bacterium]|nr:hypothetical protein [Planctomycetota bacterium]
MISVYRVLPDIDRFQLILTEDAADIMRYAFDGNEIGDAWNSPLAYCANPQKTKPDFWGCFSMSHVFAVTNECRVSLTKFFDQSSEMLPLTVEEQTNLWLCNLTCVVNALDKSQSIHKPGLPSWIEKYVFHAKRFEYSLFKIPETAKGEVLCVEGLAAPEDEFKGAVQKHGLKGLVFQKLWSTS